VAGSVEVLFADGQTAPATITGRDPQTDLAVLHVQTYRQLKVISLGSSSSVKVGQPVVAIGAPLGLSGTVTSGIVSALDRTVEVPGDNDTSALLVPAVQTVNAAAPPRAAHRRMGVVDVILFPSGRGGRRRPSPPNDRAAPPAPLVIGRVWLTTVNVRSAVSCVCRRADTACVSWPTLRPGSASGLGDTGVAALGSAPAVALEVQLAAPGHRAGSQAGSAHQLSLIAAGRRSRR
jgi:hypothetical protein